MKSSKDAKIQIAVLKSLIQKPGHFHFDRRTKSSTLANVITAVRKLNNFLFYVWKSYQYTPFVFTCNLHTLQKLANANEGDFFSPVKIKEK